MQGTGTTGQSGRGVQSPASSSAAASGAATPGSQSPSATAITYAGMSKAGIAQGGQTTDRPAVLAERLWKRGYKWLRITAADGREVGGITLNEGRRTWWAEEREEQGK